MTLKQGHETMRSRSVFHIALVVYFVMFLATLSGKSSCGKMFATCILNIFLAYFQTIGGRK